MREADGGEAQRCPEKGCQRDLLSDLERLLGSGAGLWAALIPCSVYKYGECEYFHLVVCAPPGLTGTFTLHSKTARSWSPPHPPAPNLSYLVPLSLTFSLSSSHRSPHSLSTTPKIRHTTPTLSSPNPLHSPSRFSSHSIDHPNTPFPLNNVHSHSSNISTPVIPSDPLQSLPPLRLSPHDTHSTKSLILHSLYRQLFLSHSITLLSISSPVSPPLHPLPRDPSSLSTPLTLLSSHNHSLSGPPTLYSYSPSSNSPISRPPLFGLRLVPLAPSPSSHAPPLLPNISPPPLPLPPPSPLSQSPVILHQSPSSSPSTSAERNPSPRLARPLPAQPLPNLSISLSHFRPPSSPLLSSTRNLASKSACSPLHSLPSFSHLSFRPPLIDNSNPPTLLAHCSSLILSSPPHELSSLSSPLHQLLRSPLTSHPRNPHPPSNPSPYPTPLLVQLLFSLSPLTSPSLPPPTSSPHISLPYLIQLTPSHYLHHVDSPSSLDVNLLGPSPSFPPTLSTLSPRPPSSLHFLSLSSHLSSHLLSPLSIYRSSHPPSNSILSSLSTVSHSLLQVPPPVSLSSSSHISSASIPPRPAPRAHPLSSPPSHSSPLSSTSLSASPPPPSSPLYPISHEPLSDPSTASSHSPLRPPPSPPSHSQHPSTSLNPHSPPSPRLLSIPSQHVSSLLSLDILSLSLLTLPLPLLPSQARLLSPLQSTLHFTFNNLLDPPLSPSSLTSVLPFSSQLSHLVPPSLISHAPSPPPRSLNLTPHPDSPNSLSPLLSSLLFSPPQLVSPVTSPHPLPTLSPPLYLSPTPHLTLRLPPLRSPSPPIIPSLSLRTLISSISPSSYHLALSSQLPTHPPRSSLPLSSPLSLRPLLTHSTSSSPPPSPPLLPLSSPLSNSSSSPLTSPSPSLSHSPGSHLCPAPPLSLSLSSTLHLSLPPRLLSLPRSLPSHHSTLLTRLSHCSLPPSPLLSSPLSLSRSLPRPLLTLPSLSPSILYSTPGLSLTAISSLHLSFSSNSHRSPSFILSLALSHDYLSLIPPPSPPLELRNTRLDHHHPRHSSALSPISGISSIRTRPPSPSPQHALVNYDNSPNQQQNPLLTTKLRYRSDSTSWTSRKTPAPTSDLGHSAAPMSSPRLTSYLPPSPDIAASKRPITKLSHQPLHHLLSPILLLFNPTSQPSHNRREQLSALNTTPLSLAIFSPPDSPLMSPHSSPTLALLHHSLNKSHIPLSHPIEHPTPSNITNSPLRCYHPSVPPPPPLSSAALRSPPPYHRILSHPQSRVFNPPQIGYNPTRLSSTISPLSSLALQPHHQSQPSLTHVLISRNLKRASPTLTQSISRTRRIKSDVISPTSSQLHRPHRESIFSKHPHARIPHLRYLLPPTNPHSLSLTNITTSAPHLIYSAPLSPQAVPKKDSMRAHLTPPDFPQLHNPSARSSFSHSPYTMLIKSPTRHHTSLVGPSEKIPQHHDSPSNSFFRHRKSTNPPVTSRLSSCRNSSTRHLQALHLLLIPSVISKALPHARTSIETSRSSTLPLEIRIRPPPLPHLLPLSSSLDAIPTLHSSKLPPYSSPPLPHLLSQYLSKSARRASALHLLSTTAVTLEITGLAESLPSTIYPARISPTSPAVQSLVLPARRPTLTPLPRKKTYPRHALPPPPLTHSHRLLHTSPSSLSQTYSPPSHSTLNLLYSAQELLILSLISPPTHSHPSSQSTLQLRLSLRNANFHSILFRSSNLSPLSSYLQITFTPNSMLINPRTASTNHSPYDPSRTPPSNYISLRPPAAGRTISPPPPSPHLIHSSGFDITPSYSSRREPRSLIQSTEAHPLSPTLSTTGVPTSLVVPSLSSTRLPGTLSTRPPVRPQVPPIHPPAKSIHVSSLRSPAPPSTNPLNRPSSHISLSLLFTSIPSHLTLRLYRLTPPYSADAILPSPLLSATDSSHPLHLIHLHSFPTSPTLLSSPVSFLSPSPMPQPLVLTTSPSPTAPLPPSSLTILLISPLSSMLGTRLSTHTYENTGSLCSRALSGSVLHARNRRRPVLSSPTHSTELATSRLSYLTLVSPSSNLSGLNSQTPSIYSHVPTLSFSSTLSLISLLPSVPPRPYASSRTLPLHQTKLPSQSSPTSSSLVTHPPSSPRRLRSSSYPGSPSLSPCGNITRPLIPRNSLSDTIGSLGSKLATLTIHLTQPPTTKTRRIPRTLTTHPKDSLRFTQHDLDLSEPSNSLAPRSPSQDTAATLPVSISPLPTQLSPLISQLSTHRPIRHRAHLTPHRINSSYPKISPLFKTPLSPSRLTYPSLLEVSKHVQPQDRPSTSPPSYRARSPPSNRLKYHLIASLSDIPRRNPSSHPLVSHPNSRQS
uniref:Uncharacterized protein n=1 Tax=Knipowitschia caucasica TaxID=637954 RepID=A0AAV2JQZ5_KNICA